MHLSDSQLFCLIAELRNTNWRLELLRNCANDISKTKFGKRETIKAPRRLMRVKINLVRWFITRYLKGLLVTAFWEWGGGLLSLWRVKPKFHLLRHVTTRYLAHTFWYRKKTYVLCRASYTEARHSTSPLARQSGHHGRDRHDTQL